MAKVSSSQIHLIPFDIGYVFYDVLTIDNTKNLFVAKKFIEELVKKYENHEDVIITDNLETSSINGHQTCRFLYRKFCDDCVAYVSFGQNVYCFILSSGIGMFVYYDFDGEALPENLVDADEEFSQTILANYQKKITQATILNRYLGEDTVPHVERIMLDFRLVCWQIAQDLAKKYKVKILRQFSSNIQYKSSGLSYVLTIYLLDNKVFSVNDTLHLMYSPIFNNVINKENWKKIEEKLNKKYNGDICNVKATELDIHFSWSGVGVLSERRFKTIQDIEDDILICELIKAEIYVQSKWFIADNSLDNIKGQQNTLEKMQRLLSLIEYSQAELENEVSANMSEYYKTILERIVRTSEVKKVYKSVSSQIAAQKKIKEANYEDKKTKNALIMNLFMALFTAASLFKTVVDVINRQYSTTSFILLIASLCVAVSVVLFNHYNNRR